MKWMTRFEIGARRLGESWMDLQPELDLNLPAIQAEVMLLKQNHIAQQQALLAADDQHQVEPWTNDMEQAIYDEAMRLRRQQHRDLFPLSANMI